MTDPTPPITAVPASLLDDDALRRELANTHRLHPLVEQRGIPLEQSTIRLRLAELDSEYLRRFPQAAQSWPWPLEAQPAY